MPVAHHKIKVSIFQQMILDSGHYQRGIALADLRYDHPYRKTPLRPQRPRHEVRSVIQLERGFTDALLGFVRDGLGSWRSINNKGNRSWRELQMLCQKFQTHGLCGTASAWPGNSFRFGALHGVFNARSLAQRT